MYDFRNDYSEGAHPRILQYLMESSREQNEAYGLDIHSKRAADSIKKLLGREDVDIHFIPGGTQTNMLCVSAFLKPYQCVIAADTGHINVHETGAIEGAGHKVYTVPHENGKLTKEGLLSAIRANETEHMVQPGMVYISNTTELGTAYSKEELAQLSGVCKEQGLLLFLDGARLASALTCGGEVPKLSDYAEYTDLFYIGGTKNGALFGEALVLCKDFLKKDFRYMIKNRGAMLAKGFAAGIQFEALFEDGLYFELGKHANDMALRIRTALEEKGCAFYAPPCSNQLFPIVTDDYIEKTSGEFAYNIEKDLGNGGKVIRFVTSWATTEESVEALIRTF